MKSAKLTSITRIALFTLLTIPVRLAAQQCPVDRLSRLPLDAQTSVSAALGRDLPKYQVQAGSGGFKAENAQHSLAAKFTSQGVTVRGENVLWKIALCGCGYGIVLNHRKRLRPEQNLIGLNTTAVD